MRPLISPAHVALLLNRCRKAARKALFSEDAMIGRFSASDLHDRQSELGDNHQLKIRPRLNTSPYPPFGKGGQGGFFCFIVLLLLLLSACQTPPRFTAEPLPRYDEAFQRTSGWTGGDGAYSVALGRDRVLWLFGDSFVGRVQHGRRVAAHLINNSAALQAGPEPADGSLRFVYRSLPDGRPTAFFQPEDGAGWFWPYHGVRTPQGLFLFLLQIEPAEGPAGFGFKLASTWMGKVENPDEAPENWTMIRYKIPWSDDKRLFGSSVLLMGGYCYIYGTVDTPAGGWVRKQVVLARAPADRMEDFSAWRFFADGEWVADADRAGPVCDDAAAEFSVSYQPRADRYVLVYTEGGLSEHIALRLASQPQGPWGPPIRVYRCPEVDWNPRIFCYAGKGHPEIGDAPQELIVTYVANATDLALLESDARLYRPKFIKVTFE